MTDTNINCKHILLNKTKNKTDFCKRCGCFLKLQYSDKNKVIESFSVIPKKLITSLDINPYETFERINLHIEKSNLVNYFSKLPQDYITIRRDLIELLKDYILEYNFSTRSYFLGIYIMDYIFSHHPYEEVTDKLKLDYFVLGVFLVAVKFIDDDAYPPSLDTFPNKKNPSLFYPLNEVRKYEFMVGYLMLFQLDHYTSYYLTESILSHGVIFTHELQELNLKDGKEIKDRIKKLYRLALDINKMFVEDEVSLKYNNLLIACTSIVMAKELLKFKDTWNEELEILYKVKLSDMTSCYNSILK